ncbi:hypothetical protein GGR57DRAFT_511483 [Xylariaceae sp. FL1272]|nr:hypothetical protein GGR57DRAFT_511483 [Xylariaceae sp. FL1272]
MEHHIVFNSRLTKSDRIVLENLIADAQDYNKNEVVGSNADHSSERERRCENKSRDASTLRALDSLNNPQDSRFEPTIFVERDYDDIDWASGIAKVVLVPYVSVARSIVRVDSDVVMLTHLLLYFLTSVPSAIVLCFVHFTWIHGILHFLMQISYMGTYTLMMHQHIHMRGILKHRYAIIDHLFPYITDPLMGHTWNSYFYHHVKHHHVEANGPDDLSSTIRYQRDDPMHFLHYTGRFFFLIWVDLPLYFLRKRQTQLAMKSMFWELSNYLALYYMFIWNPQPTFFVFLLPLLLLRLGLMVGNWGQHALVDPHDPASDYKSSITLIDVASNRYSFNDGYHTSHHLNPLRHWRDHPNAFIRGKHVYQAYGALVFHNIDYIMITIKLLLKDYEHLAKCMVPIGDEQLAMTLDERVALLKKCTRKLTEDEIEQKFKTL